MRAPDMRLLERGHVITPTARRAPPKRERVQRRRDWGRWGRGTAWGEVLTAAQKQAVSQEILLWMTPSENLQHYRLQYQNITLSKHPLAYARQLGLFSESVFPARLRESTGAALMYYTTCEYKLLKLQEM